MGHVHGDRLADLPLPTGWVSCWMDGPEDATGVIELFRLQYERYAAG